MTSHTVLPPKVSHRRLYGEGLVVLSSPIGSPEYVMDEVNRKIDKIRNITSLLRSLKDPHYKFVLLRLCFSLLKIMHIMRTIDPSSIQHLLSEFDNVVTMCLLNILGSPLDIKSGKKQCLQSVQVGQVYKVLKNTPQQLSLCQFCHLLH